jgi:predicted O-methyltransferase YrrM
METRMEKCLCQYPCADCDAIRRGEIVNRSAPRTSEEVQSPVDLLKSAATWGQKAYRRFSPARRAHAGKTAVTPEIVREVSTYNDTFFDTLRVDQHSARALYRQISDVCGLRSDVGESIHRLAFTVLREAGLQPCNILELGTSNGESTIYLAALFPNANVYTVELPVYDPLFTRWHSELREKLVNKRFAQYDNIHQIRANTFDLLTLNLPHFDLIWLDAGHQFPEVAWDHAYCFAHLNEEGWLLSDDIRVPGQPGGGRPGKDAPFRVIEYIRTRKTWDSGLLLKREDCTKFRSNRKYIAWFHKTSKLLHRRDQRRPTWPPARPHGERRAAAGIPQGH